ncbi:MAG: methylmalonyl Co-A mutase-associated GTPase MeaB [Candidatus Neomarinimicrobiota bacterium]
MTASLVEQLLGGSPLALAKVISLLEDDSPEAPRLIDELHPHGGSAYRVGITGPPGAGKSTLADQLTRLYRQAGRKVGILVVDPTSRFTGGAVLGDRLRLRDHFLDDGVFIRSMASRGETGGLAARTVEVAGVLEAAGHDLIIFETVGVGQTELDVAGAVDTTVVVLVPESGDEVQLMKAGIYEVADIFAVNKSDRQGADRLQSLVEQQLGLKEEAAAWKVPVCQTSATQGEGIAELKELVDRHGEYLASSGEQAVKSRARARRLVENLMAAQVMNDFWTQPRRKALDAGLDNTPPHQLAQSLLDMA